MLAVALKGLMTRKFRASLTALAIVLGVAMISGTYVLTDTINNGFNTIFQTQYKNADAIISGKAAFSNGGNGNQIENPTFPDSVLAKVKAIPDVSFAEGSVTSNAVKLVGSDGKLISSNNAPALGFSLDPRADMRCSARFRSVTSRKRLSSTLPCPPNSMNELEISRSSSSAFHNFTRAVMRGRMFPLENRSR